MSDPITTDPTPPPVEKPKRVRADQDQTLANDITEWGNFIASAKADAEIAPLLEARGYDAAEFAQGAALLAAAGAAFDQRQTTWGTQLAASQFAKELLATTSDDYVGFRELARTLFPEDAAQAGLGVSGRLPHDLGTFVTDAKASYAAGKAVPYAAKLTKRGYPPATLDGMIAALEALAKAGAEQDQAEGLARQATARRDAAYEALKAWVTECKATAKSTLRKQPALAKKLTL